MSLKDLLIPSASVKSRKPKEGSLLAAALGADGDEHTLHIRPKTTDEIVRLAGTIGRLEDNQKGDLQRQKVQAEFIVTGLCDETGASLMSFDEAYRVPPLVKNELCQLIIECSTDIGEAGKG